MVGLGDRVWRLLLFMWTTVSFNFKSEGAVPPQFHEGRGYVEKWQKLVMEMYIVDSE